MTNLVVNKSIKNKRKFGDNEFDNILRFFYVLPNFPFTTSETMRDNKHGIHELPHELPNNLSQDLRKLGNIRKVSKLHRMIA